MIALKTSKPVRLIKILDISEIKQLRKFINSDYFNNSLILAALFENLVKYYPDFDNTKLNAIAVFKKTFPHDHEYKEPKLRKRLSELSKLILQFTTMLESDNDPIKQQSLARDFFFNKNDHRFFKSMAKEALEKLEANPVRNTEYYAEKNKIHEALYLKSLEHNSIADKQHLLESIKHLDSFYKLKKLEYLCALFSRKQISSETAERLDIDSTIGQIKEISQGDEPVLDIYILLLQLHQKEANHKHFNLIFSSFKKNIALFSIKQSAFVIYQLLNYTFTQVKTKKTYFLKKQIQLYKFGLTNDIFLRNGRLSEKTFLNIAVTAAITKDFEFLSEVIAKYTEKIPLVHQDRTKTLARAFMSFHQNEYQKAYDLIHNFDETDLHFKLRTRLLSLRCLYQIQLEDKSYKDLLSSQIKTYNIFIKREKELSGNNKAAYLNFSTILKAIINRDVSLSINTIKSQLRKKIKDIDTIIAEDWLLDKIKEL